MRRVTLLAMLAVVAVPASASDSLGVYGQWGAFRDPAAGRCYAIAIPIKSRARQDYAPFAAVGTWPARAVRGQINFRLSRRLSSTGGLTLWIAGQRFALTGGGTAAWAADKAMDAAIVAAMRSARSMTVWGRDDHGARFSDTYQLEGAATAMDAASVGCARGAR